MRDLQSAGTEILTGNPSKLYIFCGTEYGIKKKYLECIANHYNGRMIELQTVADAIEKFSSFQLIVDEPALYVVRYDSDFVSKLNDKLVKKLEKCQIDGTLVLIYQESKHETKLDKHLGEYCVSLDKVSKQFMMKHLSHDFPTISAELLQHIVVSCIDYNQAINVCRIVSNIQSCSNREADMFILNSKSTLDRDIKLAVASKNYDYLCYLIDRIKSMDEFIYPILSLMLEFEKIRVQKYSDSDFKKYLSFWTFNDIYNFYDITYYTLSMSRTSQVVTDKSLCEFIASLLIFKTVPSLKSIVG